MPRMLTFMIPLCRVIGTFLLAMILGCNSCGTPPKPQVGTSQPQQAVLAVATQTPMVEATETVRPADTHTPQPADTPTVEPSNAEQICKKALAPLRKGDLSGLKELSNEKKSALEASGRLAHAIACLAVADSQTSYCGVLGTAAKEDCLKQADFVLKLKALPKGTSPAPLLANRLGELCRSKQAKADCETHSAAKKAGAGCYSEADCVKLQEAVTTKDPGKCKALPASLSAVCASMASGDASRCPKGEEGADCRGLVSSVAKLQQEGLRGLEDDLSRAGLSGKKEACTAALDNLESACIHESN